jgi:hypothetical protein
MSGAGDTPCDGAHFRDASECPDAQYADMVDMVPDYGQEPAPVANGKGKRAPRKASPSTWDIVDKFIAVERPPQIAQIFLMKLAHLHVKDKPLKYAVERFHRDGHGSKNALITAIDRLTDAGIIRRVELPEGNVGRSAQWEIRGIHFD